MVGCLLGFGWFLYRLKLKQCQDQQDHRALRQQHEARAGIAPEQGGRAQPRHDRQQVDDSDGLRTGEAHPHESVRDVVVVADVERLVVVQADENDSEGVEDRDCEDEKRDQDGVFRCGDVGVVVGYAGADHREQEPDQMAARVAHEDRRRGFIEDPEPAARARRTRRERRHEELPAAPCRDSEKHKRDCRRSILYDWFVEKCEMENVPHQYEFGRLNITNTIMSKRYLRQLVDGGYVTGYDDPRMPTLVALKRKGFTPEAIKAFIRYTGLSRINSTTDVENLNFFLREDQKLKATRPMAVLNPLKVVIDNYPEDQIEQLVASNNMENEELGTRMINFGKYLYIEKEDFVEEKPNRKWKRLSVGDEVRLMHAYFIRCNSVVKDENGDIVEIHCTYDPETKSGSGFEGRKPNGTIHFVEATTALKATFNLYEPLIFDETEETKGTTFIERLNPNSLVKLEGFVETSLKDTKPLDRFQFIRNGYYCTDKESTKDNLIFNRTCSLKSSFN